jgi:uncharacterized protein (TIGR03643 family)
VLFFDAFHIRQTIQPSYCFLFVMKQKALDIQDIDRIIEMAWEDRTPFDAILLQFGLKEAEVIALMRRELKPSSWRLWRARVQGRATKHSALRGFEVGRHKCNLQRNITGNKISKR